MFEFLLDANNYEDRKIDRYEKGDLFISTARVSDSTQPFETAVAHPQYNGGKIVIVEQYDTKEEAQQGHDKWIKIMTASKLPRILTDISQSNVKRMGQALGVNFNDINECGKD